MPKQSTDHLIQLICSLTRAEKRHFRTLAGRHGSSEELLFLQLFDLLDKYQAYDEAVILRKLPAVKKQQLPNLKAHLYQQLLTSLRLLNKNYDPEIQLREMIDYARVLYNKGLHGQSLEMLDKTKTRALKGRHITLALEVVEFEKLIESQYITRSLEGRAEHLSREAWQLSHKAQRTNTLSNLALQLYGLYLKVGYVRNAKDYFFIREFFQARLPRLHVRDLSFHEKTYYYQSHIWYYHLTLDFPQCYRYTQKWIDLFRAHPEMIVQEAPLYLKALHNHLGTLFRLGLHEKFVAELGELDVFKIRHEGLLTQSRNVESLYHLYYYIHRINRHYLEATFREGRELIPGLAEILQSDRYGWDYHREMVFHYRIACLYFGSGDYGASIDYLNRIVNQTSDLRGDIQCFARLLRLIAYFELGNDLLLEYQIKSVYRYLSKMEDLQRVQLEIFQFLRQAFHLSPAELKGAFANLKERLEKIKTDPYESRPFIYLDIIAWLESKLEGKSIEAVMQRNFLNRQGSRAT